VDLLGRDALVDAIVDQICERSSSAEPNLSGPSVVAIEGPWGSGKSTLMQLVRKKLAERQGRHSKGRSAFKRLTVIRAMRLLRGGLPAMPTRSVENPSESSFATAWYNPWVHQSGEQTWAGLTEAIVEAARPVLYPAETQREAYWFRWNAGRLDRQMIRRALYRRILSPLLGFSLVAVALPLAITFLQLEQPLHLGALNVDPSVLALVPPLGFLLAGLVHTALRYLGGSASGYLPASLFHGPVSGVSEIDRTDRANPWHLSDPLQEARAGSLYLDQHGVHAVLSDMSLEGYQLVVFVDDLDRCRPSTLGEVFEAINVFLSGVATSVPEVRFVIGLDPAVVVDHLDRIYGDGAGSWVNGKGVDPSPGWAFLRKLVQLPVRIPRLSESAISTFVASATSLDPHPTVPQHRSTLRAGPSLLTDPTSRARRGADSLSPSFKPAPNSRQPQATRGVAQARPVHVIPWRSLERHPSVGEFLRQRLQAQSEPSIREAKRLINVWQFLERRLSRSNPLTDPAAILVRARHLIVLAEIVTRWPAIQDSLHRIIDGSTGLGTLAANAADDASWAEAISHIGIDEGRHGHALDALRSLLREHDGIGVASLAARLY
jgi:hypothetical protein